MKLFKKQKDIKYRGFLNHKSLKLVGLILISISQLSLAYTIFKFVDLGKEGILYNVNLDLIKFLTFLSNIGLPLLLIATFSNIINQKENLKRTIITYGVLALSIYLAQLFCFEFLLGPLIDKYNIVGDYTTNEIVNTISYFFSFFNNLNIFIDLFICSIFYLFFCYTPKRIKKENLWKYRLLSIIPIIYMIVSFILIYLNHNLKVVLSNEISGLLTFRKPPIFIFFILYCIFTKYREKYLKKKLKTNKKYEKYIESNRNSLVVSIYLILAIIFISGLDYFLSMFKSLYAFGFGYSYYMIFCIPVLLLYSPTRKNDSIVLDIVTDGYYIINYVVLISLYGLVVFNINTVFKDVIPDILGCLPAIKELIFN